jgi:hypothetical protein
VWDKDKIGKDDFLGKGEIELKPDMPKGEVTVNLKNSICYPKAKCSGTITFNFFHNAERTEENHQ